MKISILRGTIGPRHDPYSSDLLTVRVGSREADWYQDGLGNNKVWLTDGPNLVREFEWIDDPDSKECRNKQALAKILFRRWVGITTWDAEDQYNRSYQSDPYGSPSDYT